MINVNLSLSLSLVSLGAIIFLREEDYFRVKYKKAI